MAPKKVILDSDMGHDDAIALMLALSFLDVLAVTTVAGNYNVGHAYKNAVNLLDYLGKDVEAAMGAEKPIFGPYKEFDNPYVRKKLSDFLPDKKILHPKSAQALLRSVLGKDSQKVTLIAVGPLTNLATLLLAEPELKEKIDEIIFMGGSFGGGNVTSEAEFNFFVDPEAAKIVLKSGLPLTMVGLDVTEKALVYPKEVQELKEGGRVCALAARIIDCSTDFYKAKGFSGNPIHDALAVAAAFVPKVLDTEQFCVEVLKSGKSVINTNGRRNCKVAVNADRALFLSTLFSGLKKLDGIDT